MSKRMSRLLVGLTLYCGFFMFGGAREAAAATVYEVGPAKVMPAGGVSAAPRTSSSAPGCHALMANAPFPRRNYQPWGKMISGQLFV
jgi:hypothetical protein